MEGIGHESLECKLSSCLYGYRGLFEMVGLRLCGGNGNGRDRDTFPLMYGMGQ